MWLGWSVAAAQTCGSASWPVDSLPRAGDAVPPDAVVTLFFGDRAPTCPPPTVEVTLLDPDDRPVEVRTSALDPSALQLVPAAPLAPGLHRVVVEEPAGTGSYAYGTYTYEYGLSEVSFLVDPEAAPPAPALGALDATHRNRCRNTFFGPTVSARIAIDAPGVGLLRTRVVTDGVPGPWSTARVLGPDDDGARVVRDVAPGLHDLCLEAQVVNVRGDVVDTAGPACFSQRNCPPQESPRGCATTPAAPALGALAALLAAPLARRRRP